MDAALVLVLALVLIIVIILVIMAITGGRHPSPQPEPYPVAVPVVGGCAGTRYGCCPDGTTAKSNYYGTNCYNPDPWPYPYHPHRHHHRHHRHHHHKMVGGCAGTRWGCCPGSSIAKANRHGSNCP